MLSAEQKMRQTLTENPFGEPVFHHEGEEVIRWITGGLAPSIYVTFHHNEDMVEVRCATCKNILGTFDPRDGEDTARQLFFMRQNAHHHEKE